MCWRAKRNSSFVARTPDGLPASRRPWRNSRRPICRWIPRRTIRSAGGSRVRSRNARRISSRRNSTLSAADPFDLIRDPRARRASAGDFRQDSQLSGWSALIALVRYGDTERIRSQLRNKTHKKPLALSTSPGSSRVQCWDFAGPSLRSSPNRRPWWNRSAVPDYTEDRIAGSVMPLSVWKSLKRSSTRLKWSPC